jgi:hypothetical protein
MVLPRNLGQSLSLKRAIAELVLIVLGVLIALAVNAWWTDREDAARQRAYLEQLLVDVRSNEQDVSRVIAQTRTANAALERLVSALDAARHLPPCDTLHQLIRATLTYSNVDLRSGTYAALMATGDIRLIRDNDLRAEIISSGSEVQGASARLEQWIPLLWDTAEPLRRRLDYLWRLRQPTAPTDPAPWSKCNLEPLRHDAEIRSALFSIGQGHRNREDALKTVGEASERLRNSLESVSGLRPLKGDR